MPNSKYIRINYCHEFPVVNHVVSWLIDGPLRLIDSLITILSLGIITSEMSIDAADRFHLHRLTRELQIEEKING